MIQAADNKVVMQGLEMLLSSSIDTARYSDELEARLGHGMVAKILMTKFLESLTWINKSRLRHLRKYVSVDCMVDYLLWSCFCGFLWYHKKITCEEAEKHFRCDVCQSLQ